MSHLFDTQLLIWTLKEPMRLPEAAALLMEDPVPGRHFSVASVWEIAIKSALRKPGFDVSPGMLRERLLDAGFAEVPISGSHALAVRELPAIHGDPFDRMLIAQAITDGLTLVTSDKALAAYPATVMVV